MVEVLLVSVFFEVCVGDVVWVSFYGNGLLWVLWWGSDDRHGRIWKV